MTDKPIIFSAPMVRALLEGRKTQTRRILKPQPDDLHEGQIPGVLRISAGDRLWVREGFSPIPEEAPPEEDRPTDWLIAFAAGGQEFRRAPSGYNPMLYNYSRYSPSIHMPRWASRLTLIVESVKVERLQDISDEDADAECFAGGFPGDALPELFPGDRSRWSHLTIQQCFARLWNSIHGPDSWGTNPWVAAITFRVIKANIGSPEASHDR